MGNKKLAALTVAVLLSLSAAGCAATETESPTPTPSPTATGLGKVSTIDELRDAFIAEGGVCNWNQTDVVRDATASGDCSDQTVLSIYADVADRDLVVDRLVSFGLDELTLLVGDNWIINSPEAESMQPALGGEWIDD